MTTKKLAAAAADCALGKTEDWSEVNDVVRKRGNHRSYSQNMGYIA